MSMRRPGARTWLAVAGAAGIVLGGMAPAVAQRTTATTSAKAGPVKSIQLKGRGVRARMTLAAWCGVEIESRGGWCSDEAEPLPSARRLAPRTKVKVRLPVRARRVGFGLRRAGTPDTGYPPLTPPVRGKAWRPDRKRAPRVWTFRVPARVGEADFLFVDGRLEREVRYEEFAISHATYALPLR